MCTPWKADGIISCASRTSVVSIQSRLEKSIADIISTDRQFDIYVLPPKCNYYIIPGPAGADVTGVKVPDDVKFLLHGPGFLRRNKYDHVYVIPRSRG